MRTSITATLAVAAALWLVGGAGAGGWATVGVSPQPEDDAQAGAVWTPTLTVLQHGRTPLDGVHPTVMLSNGKGQLETFAATPTGKPGTYAARVRFASSGTWSVRVNDGFGREHGFPDVTIGAAETSSSSALRLPVALGALLAIALGSTLLLRRRRQQGRLVASGVR